VIEHRHLAGDRRRVVRRQVDRAAAEDDVFGVVDETGDEDQAGLIIRLLKISKRIACIFEIASQCEEYVGVSMKNKESRIRIPISAQNMQMAINLVNYLQFVHISNIMLYADSPNGKISKSDIVFNLVWV